jgi:putative ABC transport system substrate-binding protein
LARPGFNLTGVTVDAGLDIHGKHLELLREAVPGARKLGFLVPEAALESPYGLAMRDVAERAGVWLIGPPLRDPIGAPEYRRVIQAMQHAGAEGIIVRQRERT